jgi:HEPN domain-containing protein
MRQEVIDWFKQAKADLKTAGNCLKSRDYYASVFFSQQAAEKSLKALYINEKRQLPPRTHSLIGIGRTLQTPANITSALRDLSPEYIITRYPNAAYGIPADIYDEEKAKDRLKKAKVIMQWVKEKLKIEP